MRFCNINVNVCKERGRIQNKDILVINTRKNTFEDEPPSDLNAHETLGSIKSIAFHNFDGQIYLSFLFAARRNCLLNCIQMKVLAGHIIPCYNRNSSFPVMQNCSGKKPEKLLMRPWLIEQVEKGDIPGLKYLDEEQTLIQIPWTHGSRHGWEADRDACLFKRWDIHTGRYGREEREDPKRWKATFRNAIHSLPDVIEVKEKSKTKGIDAFRVFKLCEEKEKPKKARRSSESDGDQHFRKYATHADRLERFRKLKKKANLKKARREDDRQQSESDSSVSSTSSSFEGAQNTALAAAAASQASTDCQQNSQWFGEQPDSYYQHSHLTEEVMDMSEAANTYTTLNLEDF